MGDCSRDSAGSTDSARPDAARERTVKIVAGDNLCFSDTR